MTPGDGLLPPGLTGASAGAWGFVLFVIGWWLLMQSPRLAGLLRPSRDPVAWLLGGMVAAGTGAAWLMWHPSASQLYFFLAVAPFGVMLTVALLARLEPGRRPLLIGLAAGALSVPLFARPTGTDRGDWLRALGVPLLVVLLILIVIGFVLARRRVAVVLLAAGLGASLGTTLFTYVPALGDRAVPNPARLTTAAEMAAALWLDDHTGNDDVVATNVHCVPVGRAAPCDARAFWVAGLGGRRVVVESWAYSDETVAANGVGGVKYFFQPAPDPAVFALNERIFTDADPAALAELRQRYGVRWLFADTRAGPVSPELAALAPVRFARGPVTVHEVA